MMMMVMMVLIRLIEAVIVANDVICVDNDDAASTTALRFYIYTRCVMWCIEYRFMFCGRCVIEEYDGEVERASNV